MSWFFFFLSNLPPSCNHVKNPTHLTYADASNGSLPQGDCHQRVPPAAGAQISPWPERRSQRHACLWSQTWPHLAARSGSWHNPAWGVGSWCQSQQPLGRSTEELPGWHFRCSAATESRRSPEQKQNSQEKFTQSASKSIWFGLSAVHSESCSGAHGIKTKAQFHISWQVSVPIADANIY